MQPSFVFFFILCYNKKEYQFFLGKVVLLMYRKGFVFDSSFLRSINDTSFERFGRYVLVKPFGAITTHRELALYFIEKYFSAAYHMPGNKITNPEDFMVFSLKAAQIRSQSTNCILLAFDSPLARDVRWRQELGIADYKVIVYNVEF